MYSKRRTFSRFTVTALGAAGVLIIAAACSSSGSGSSASSSGGSSGSPAATSSSVIKADAAAIATLSPSGSANSIVVTGKLSSPPPKGKVVYWLEANLPVTEELTPGFKAATAALGWDLHIITYSDSDPNGASAAMQQAVSANPKPDYIAVTGNDIATLGQGLVAAKQAGIPVFADSAGADTPTLKANGLYTNTEGPNFETAVTKDVSDYIIANSNGQAHVLVVSTPEAPILKLADEAVNQEYGKCSGCTVTKLNATFTDLANGSVPSEIVSAIQAHPSINYIQLTYGDLGDGLPQQLAAAGLKTKIVGAAANTQNLQSLAAGTSTAYAVQGEPESAFVMVDGMVRYSEGQPINQLQHDLVTVQIWTPQDMPKPVAEYKGAASYARQFEELWDLSPSS